MTNSTQPNFSLNQVLSINELIMPALFVDCEPSTDRYEVSLKDAQHKISLIALKARDMVDDWNHGTTKGIRLCVEKGHTDGIRIVGEWADCLAINDNNKEMDYRIVAGYVAQTMMDVLDDIYPTLDLICHFEESADTVITNLKHAFFMRSEFSELHNTTFFKHINKIFNVDRLQEIFQEVSDTYSGSFYPTESEELASFKSGLKQSFFELLEESQRITDAVIGFELEQVAQASDRAWDITKVCSRKPALSLRSNPSSQ
jgi:hypothetical protein